MPKKLYPEESIQSIAKAIRSRNGLEEETYKVGEMADAINSLDIYTLVGEDNAPYLYRQAPDLSADYDREYDTIIGGSVVENQLTANNRQTQTLNGVAFTNDGNGTITANGTATANVPFYSDASPSINMIPNHIYYFCGCPSGGTASTYRLGLTQGGSSISLDYGDGKIAKASSTDTGALSTVVFVANGATVNNLKFTPQVIDLTQMFGTSIADYAYQLEQSTAGSGIAWLKSQGFLAEDYIPFNEGEIKSVSGLVSHDMVGFNHFDKSAMSAGYIDNNNGAFIPNSGALATDYIPVFPNTNYYIKNDANSAFGGAWYDAEKHYISEIALYKNTIRTSPNRAAYMRLTVKTQNNGGNPDTFCINLSDPNRNGEYEPYNKHSYPLDSSLTLRGIPKLVDGKIQYNGDVYHSDGSVEERYGIVDLGTLNWDYQQSWGAEPTFYAYKQDSLTPPDISIVANMICSKYKTISNAEMYNIGTDKCVCKNSSVIRIADSSYTDAATFKAAMSGVMLVYEKATPTTSQAEPFSAIQICDPNGTEEYVTTRIPVGHETKYLETV